MMSDATIVVLVLPGFLTRIEDELAMRDKKVRNQGRSHGCLIHAKAERLALPSDGSIRYDSSKLAGVSSAKDK